MAKQKKLMVLGASVGQLPLIHKAVELGHYVITVDYIPDNVGHQFSHHYVNCSTVDQLAVLRAAQALDIDGIATFASDVATATVGFVTEQLELPGCSQWIAQTMSHKANFRKFQRTSGLNNPGFVVGEKWERVEPLLRTLSLPVMFKPVDTSGSRGITRVDAHHYAQYRAAFDYAHSYARSKLVCVEEFIEGTDVSGDGFLLNGKLHAVITQKYKQGYIPTGHSLPTNLSEQDQARVFDEITATCRALGYDYGPVDFDVKVSPERVVVIEMSPRLGGNGIPKLIKRATGVDLVEATVHYALGEPVKLPDKLEVKRRCGSWVFGSEHAGTVAHVTSENEILAQVPEVFEYIFSYQVGEDAPRFEHSGNSLGYALFDCPSAASYHDMIARLRKVMQLRITAPNRILSQVMGTASVLLPQLLAYS